jgi:NDP-sugar pyrophosphorylase family protein
VYQSGLGTGAGLRAAESKLIGEERFLVIGADDIFQKKELEQLFVPRASYGIYYGLSGKGGTTDVLFDEHMRFHGFGLVKNFTDRRYLGVGAYVLPQEIFQQIFISLPNDELSIPHTLIHATFPVEVVIFKQWLPVNNQEERKYAEAMMQLFIQAVLALM